MDAVARFQGEVWSLYTLALCFTCLRMFSRWRIVGIKGLRADDWAAALSMIFYSALTGIAHTGGTLYYSTVARRPPNANPFPPPGSPAHPIWIRGVRLHISSWFMYTSTLWTLKISLLLLYLRLTTGLTGSYRARTLVGFGFVAASWVAVILTIFLGCRPFSDYQVSFPPPPNHCQPAVSRPIIIACYTGNVFTDLYLISIPLPMLWSTSMALWKKVGLGILFSGGIVIIVFATIRSVLIITTPVRGAPLSGQWAVREAFVAVITTNTPMVFTLVKHLLGPTFRTTQRTGPTDDKMGTPLSGMNSSRTSKKPRASAVPNPTMTNMIFSESEERIVNGRDTPPPTTKRESHTPSQAPSSHDIEYGIAI
ncbi:hypothetical protein B0I35DRAFT_160739 [Stachybotrys elegans]|uniref:Rhodopsin domain-containing protein n=1 Tax=Stachybotrys elegans TaxID=80388 RepID=A0A8K0SVY1_9HYPO|nr:hypothetical protein B0I35DRAFT_160739 [Stachybotrys elegans]